ncbi:MAG: T9SS type A sorting domain-containing protein [Ignavibacteria bacterium]|nr:T9SS type A sorting domain-containing protein [Ignavibacteria bacterium]
MKKLLPTLLKFFCLILLFIFTTTNSYGIKFTAIKSGNYSNPAIWDLGIAPPFTNDSNVVYIPALITINLDSNLVYEGVSAALVIDGYITSTKNISITLNKARLSGLGRIIVNEFRINTNSFVYFTGQITAEHIYITDSCRLNATLQANQTLTITSSTLTFTKGSYLWLKKSATIILDGGSIHTENKSSLYSKETYNVIYQGNSSSTGIELSGSGLNNVTIDVDTNNTVTLLSDVMIAGTLALKKGTLVLDSTLLTINGSIDTAGKGHIASGEHARITINSANGTLGALDFGSTISHLKNLSINVGNNKKASIRGSLSVDDSLVLKNGTLTINDASLIIKNIFTGNGALQGNRTTNLILDSKSSAPISLPYSGQSIHDLTILGEGIRVTPASSLTIGGVLFMNTSGSFNLNGNTLVLDTGSVVSGNGKILVNPASNMTILSSGGIGSLQTVGTLGNLTIDCNDKVVQLATPLTIAGVLSLKHGGLSWYGNELTIRGDIAANGSGLFYSDSTSSLSILTPAPPQREVPFAPEQNSLKTMKINIANGGFMRVGSLVSIKDTLMFIKGSLDIGQSVLRMGESGVILGGGSTSYINTESDGAVEINVPNGINPVLFPLGTSKHYSPAKITINPGSSNRNIQVGVVNSVKSRGILGEDISSSQPLVGATWNISSQSQGNLNAKIQLQWTSLMEMNGFNRKTAYISQFGNGLWDSSPVDEAVDISDTIYSLTRKSVSSFGSFSVFDIKTITGVDEANSDNSFELLSHPSSNEIEIRSLNSSQKPLTITIYNTLGQVMGIYTTNGTTTIIPTTSLLTGVYIMELKNEQMKMVKSFVWL